MASENGRGLAHPISSTTAFPKSPLSTTSPQMINSSDPSSPGLVRAAAADNSLHPSDSSSLSSIASAGLQSTLSPRSPKSLGGLSSRYSPRPLTGLAGLVDDTRLRKEKEREESQKKSPNPASAALKGLLSRPSGLSKPEDAPDETTSMSDGLAVAANAITVPDSIHVDHAQPSPGSTSSFFSTNGLAPTASTTSAPLGSPSEIVASASDREQKSDRHPGKAMTLPGPLHENEASANDAPASNRGMSLPMPGSSQETPRSPTSTRRHKCPYCSTDFTRHHNLKSHLLTHSQEKPYVCSTCQSRFRRLHDLKRHSKLHTGERPHICSRCGRRFARGDALARHNKGHGGCAGRRASMGSLGGDDDDDDDGDGSHDGQMAGQGSSAHGETMVGVVYTGESGLEVDHDDEDKSDMRSVSLPSIHAQDGPPGLETHHSAPHITQGPAHINASTPSTYPPASVAAGARGGLLPPTGRGSVSSSIAASSGPSPAPLRHASIPQNPSAASVYAQGGMTESPKPISPGASGSMQLGHSDVGGLARMRSPSLTQQFQQQHFGRRTSGRTPPSLPPLGGNSQAPHLPSLPGLAPNDPRFGPPVPSPGQHHGSHNAQSSPFSYHSGGPHVSTQPHSATPFSAGPSNSGSEPAHGPSSGEGSANLFTAGNEGLWAYIRALDERVSVLSDQVGDLKDQLADVKRRNRDGPSRE